MSDLDNPIPLDHNTDRPEMAVEFTNVVYEVPSSTNDAAPTRILHGVSGALAVGESLAILGPSGSGKTTLLNLLADRSMYGLAGGRILFNGSERTSRTKREIGYVMQDDLFFSQLTVRETLQFTADIRIPDTATAEEKSARIDELVASLRLTRCQNTHIGDQMFFKGISGGERKRLNIANELIHNPSILLGDECTSGLDSASAYTVIQLVRQLSQQGKTIICTIHQPSTQMFNLFDKVMLLSSGRIAYFGRPDAVHKYFSSIGYPFPSTSYNPADYLLELIIDDLPPEHQDSDIEDAVSQSQLTKKNILDAWSRKGPNAYLGTDVTNLNSETNESDNVMQPTTTIELRKGPVRAMKKRYWAATGHRDHDPLPTKYPVRFLGQTWALMKRSMRQKRGSLLDRMNIVQTILTTVICVLFWFRMRRTEDTIDDRLGALFFFNVYWGFIGAMAAIFTFPSERAVLNKDRASGAYRLSAYYLAKNIVEMPADLVYPLVFTIVTYWAIGLNPSFVSFLLHVITMVLSISASLSIGIVVSAVFVNVKEAQVCASMWILGSMLCGGYFIAVDNLPAFMRPLTYISYLKNGYESYVRIEARGQFYNCVIDGKPHTIYSESGKSCPVGERALLRAAQINDKISITGNLLILILWIVVLRLIGYFALKYINRSHKPRQKKIFKKK